MSLSLPRGEVHLWLARPARAADPELSSAYLALLSPDERLQHERFAFLTHRREYLVTRALVRTVLSRYGPLPPADWRFPRTPWGRPGLDPPLGLDFNLSNAAGMVACAVSHHRVGVDLEPWERGDAIVSLAGEVLSEAERSALAQLPLERRPLRALACWTLKEAYLKARGTGLGLPLRELAFSVDRLGPIAAAFGPAVADDPTRWKFRLLDHAGHRVALASAAPWRLRAFEVVPLLAGSEVAVSMGVERGS